MRRILRWLVPSEGIFYDMLKAQSSNSLNAAEALHELMAGSHDEGKVKALMQRLEAAEARGEDSRHEIVKELNQSLITPFDREDIYALSQALHDVAHLTEEAALKLGMYGVKTPPAELVELSSMLVSASREVDAGVSSLQKGYDGTAQRCRHLRSLDRKAGALSREYVARLFGSRDSLEILKQKELFEAVDGAIDRCREISYLIEGILVKAA